MAQKVLAIAREELRRELAADLGRGGYVLQAGTGENAERYFEKALVLCRPGLLARAADLLSDLLPETCERIAVNGVSASALGTALSLVTGVPLLLGGPTTDGLSFQGDLHRAAKVVLLEDVVFTGERALSGARALAERARRGGERPVPPGSGLRCQPHSRRGRLRPTAIVHRERAPEDGPRSRGLSTIGESNSAAARRPPGGQPDSRAAGRARHDRCRSGRRRHSARLQPAGACRPRAVLALGG